MKIYLSLFVAILAEQQFKISGSNFNFEIGSRVHDKVLDYLQFLSNAGGLPLNIIHMGIVDISLPFISNPILFYPSMLQYKEKVLMYFL